MIEVLGERVLVRADKPEEKTEGGIVLQEAAKDKPVSGTIVLVSKNCSFKPGQRIYYFSYSGTKMRLKLTDKLEEFEFLPIKEILAKEVEKTLGQKVTDGIN
jgi:chaperonin GroES